MKPSFLLLALCSTLLTTQANAKTPDSPAPEQAAPDAAAESESKRIRADQLYRQANELFRARKLEPAIEKYKEALALKSTYDIAGNLGTAELALERYVDAATHLALSLRIYPVNAAATEKQVTLDLLKKARAKVSTLRITAPAGATVMLDSQKLGTAPLEHEVYCTPGKHRLEARLAEHATTTLDINAKAGEENPLILPKGANLSTDSRGLKPSPAVLGVGYGLAGAGLITGIALTLVANGKSSDAQAIVDGCGGPCTALADRQKVEELRADQGTMANAAFAAYLGAGVMAVATSIYWGVAEASAGAEPHKDTLRIVPTISPSQAGASITIRF